MEDSLSLFWGSVLNEQCDVTNANPSCHVTCLWVGDVIKQTPHVMSCVCVMSCVSWFWLVSGPVPVPGPGPVLSTPGSLTLVLSFLSTLWSIPLVLLYPCP